MLANVLGAQQQQQQNVGNRSQYSVYIDKHKGSKPKSNVKALDRREHIYLHAQQHQYIYIYIYIYIPYLSHIFRTAVKHETS